MSDKVAFRATLNVTAKSEALVTAFAIEHLQERGFRIIQPGQWEKLGKFMERLGVVKYESVHYSIALWERRGNSITVAKSPKGQIREILSDPEFDKFVRRNCK